MVRGDVKEESMMVMTMVMNVGEEPVVPKDPTGAVKGKVRKGSVKGAEGRCVLAFERVKSTSPTRSQRNVENV